MGLCKISVYDFCFERVCSHIRMGILETGLYIMFVLVYRVCTHVRLGIIATRVCVNVSFL